MTALRTHTVIDSPIGELTLVNTDGVLSGVYMAEHRPAPDRTGFGEQTTDGFDEAITQFAEYFAGRRTRFTVPTAPVGTPFQREVWESLKMIEYGTTRTYSEIALALGRPTAVRAVAAANARNPLCIIVPCHRVIGSGGKLTGYAGGIERKRFLLDQEAQMLRSGDAGVPADTHVPA
ncbi:methylated-DNA--[protein]-cysteine S-methyltransferase [Rhodococcus sp. B50]|uniref:methylated-DNA--[protein]-cysteine S-methyltransferase n=1 Tax=Rhodococcus sp. B50 TaxID=2682847 RepID=UPI0019E89493|nr:methylated-DNA--[protein]-cysteine S-methyltransferase [Rhodococcus sp. B50]MBS9374949.1 Methylated-DNA--protein-cysteine methyltransferase [Rhodococcus sp. B50]